MKKSSRSASDKTRYIYTYPHVVIFLLRKHATNEVIVETESDITPFLQLSHMTLSQYTEELVTNTLRCRDDYDECALKEIFTDGLDVSVRHSLCEN